MSLEYFSHPSPLVDGVEYIRLKPHVDDRGLFMETRRDSVFGQFRQSNVSVSKSGVLRGMHIDTRNWKLVMCVGGMIFDAVVDMRPGSPTYRKYATYMLAEGKPAQVLIPPGCAHGFFVMAGPAIVVYHLSGEYDEKYEEGLAFDDPGIGIDWPVVDKIIISHKDAHWPHREFVLDTGLPV